MYMDWTFILLIPGIILALIAQARVSSSFNRASKISSRSGMNAEQISSLLLRTHGCSNVQVVSTSGRLTDHYNPQNKTLALSEGVYGNSSLAAIGVAAHEAGHAIQDAEGYGPLRLRTALVPVVSFGSSLSPIIFIAGIIFSFKPLISIGIILFALTVVFSLITLPVEFDASRRAKSLLVSDGYLSQEELKSVNSVLDAAALTYVAALVNGLLQLLRLILISRNRD